MFVYSNYLCFKIRTVCFIRTVFFLFEQFVVVKKLFVVVECLVVVKLYVVFELVVAVELVILKLVDVFELFLKPNFLFQSNLLHTPPTVNNTLNQTKFFPILFYFKFEFKPKNSLRLTFHLNSLKHF